MTFVICSSQLQPVKEISLGNWYPPMIIFLVTFSMTMCIKPNQLLTLLTRGRVCLWHRVFICTSLTCHINMMMWGPHNLWMFTVYYQSPPSLDCQFTFNYCKRRTRPSQLDRVDEGDEDQDTIKDIVLVFHCKYTQIMYVIGLLLDCSLLYTWAKPHRASGGSVPLVENAILCNFAFGPLTNILYIGH